MKRFTLLCLLGFVSFVQSNEGNQTLGRQTAFQPVKIPVKETHIPGSESHLYKKHEFQQKFQAYREEHHKDKSPFELQRDFLKDITKHVPSNLIKRYEKRILQGPIVNLDNLDGVYYTGPLYMGSSYVEQDVVYDTGSAWLVLHDKLQCSTCPADLAYDKSSSTTFSVVSSTTQSLAYGSAQVQGYQAQDSASLDSSGTNKATMRFFMNTAQSGLDAFSGILGMARGDVQLSSLGTQGPRLVSELATASVIPSRIFSFYMTDAAHQSFVELGGYSNSYMKNSADLSWIPCDDTSFFWEVEFEGYKISDDPTITVNGKTIPSAYTFATSYPNVIMDTGTTLNYLPTMFWYDFMEQLMRNHPEAYDYGGIVTGSCDLTTYDTVYFYMNGRFYGIDPSTYVITLADMPGECVMGFANGGDMFLMGASLLRNYYSIWDDDNSQMALVPHLESLTTVTVATAPTDIYTEPEYAFPFSYTTFASAVGGTYAVIGGLGYLVYQVYFMPIINAMAAQEEALVTESSFINKVKGLFWN